MADKSPKTKKQPEIEDSRPLDEQLAAKRADLLEAQKGLGNTLANPHVIKKLRKEIARSLTKINSREGKK